MIRLLLLSALLVLVAPVAMAQAPADTLTVVLVRHAEVTPDGTRDPGLSDAGRQRAAALAADLDGLVAAYATEYRRTQETATPAAQAAELDVTVVPFGAGPLEAYTAALADRVRAHTGGTVLVVGHSNTIPALAEALTGEPVAPIAEDEFDRVIRVVLGPDRADG